MSQCALSVALTGGIASGKSIVSEHFVRRGVPVFDADVIARELVASGQPALAAITAAFGSQMLTAAGDLDRQRMRELIFSNADARVRLESILHPRIREELSARAKACSNVYCLLAIPLLAENHDAYRWVDRVLVVDAHSDTQIARLMSRDGMDLTRAQKMLDAQATREQRLAIADDVIDNDGALARVDTVVERLDKFYRAI